MFAIPEDFVPDAIIEMPCPWKIEEAFTGTDPQDRAVRKTLKEDGATQEAIEDAWRYGMACEATTRGFLYTGDPNAKKRMAYGHYFEWDHDGNKRWRVIVEVPQEKIVTCYPRGERGKTVV